MERRRGFEQQFRQLREYAVKRARGETVPIETLDITQGGVDLEPTDKETVERRIQDRDEQFPVKEVLVTDPVTGQKRYDTRRERESNAFITINTHQVPIIGKTEVAMQTALMLVLNSLFSQEEMKYWIEIKEPFLSAGDVWTLDPEPESSIFKSIDMKYAIEIGPINQMLHTHIICNITHYSLIRYNAGMLGRRAAELWRRFFPMDLQPSPADRDVSIQEFIMAYEEELRYDAVNPDFTIDNQKLYAEVDPNVAMTSKGIPRSALDKRGFHKISNVAQFRTFFKDQGLYNNLLGNRNSMEQKCRKYISENLQKLRADADRVIHHTKSMHCQIQITQSNAEINRMNYISKNKAGVERDVVRSGSLGAGPLMS